MPRPRALTCYICGRGYGTASLKIHLPQCEKLFLQQEAQKPKHERRPLPKRPDILDAGGDTSAQAMEAYNDAAFQTYNEQALIKCENCGRTFLPDSLKHHQNACTADKPARPIGGKVMKGTTGPFVENNMNPSTETEIQKKLRRNSNEMEKPWKKPHRKLVTPSEPSIQANTTTSSVREQLAEAQEIDRQTNSPNEQSAALHHSGSTTNLSRNRRGSKSRNPLELLHMITLDLLDRGYSPDELKQTFTQALKG